MLDPYAVQADVADRAGLVAARSAGTIEERTPTAEDGDGGSSKCVSDMGQSGIVGDEYGEVGDERAQCDKGCLVPNLAQHSTRTPQDRW